MRAAVRLPRAGYSLVELLVVIAILVALGAVVAPSLKGMTGDTKVKAAADLIRGRAAEARGAAVGENRGYRLAISTDGARVRIAPDDQAFDTQAISPDDDVDGPVVTEDALPAGVTARPLFDAGRQGVTDDAGWVRVATFHTDGTCRDDLAVIEVREPGVPAWWVRIRGLTGAAGRRSRPVGSR